MTFGRLDFQPHNLSRDTRVLAAEPVHRKIMARTREEREKMETGVCTSASGREIHPLFSPAAYQNVCADALSVRLGGERDMHCPVERLGKAAREARSGEVWVILPVRARACVRAWGVRIG